MSYLWYWPAGGWDFAKWKSAHAWSPIKSEQSGNAKLVPLIPAGATREDWEQARKKWLDIATNLLGEINDKPPTKMRWEFLTDPLTRNGASPFTMQRLRYTLTAPADSNNAESVEWGYAWLLRPVGDVDTKRPAVIALHQTVMQGKNEPVGLETRPHDPGGMEYARHLAERGCIVFAPDVIAFGERAADHSNAKYRSADEFFAANPSGSVMKKMVFDVSRAVDLLSTLAGVDPDKIGCIGHSHGGYGTLFAMVFDDRIKAGVISCGFNTLRDDPKPMRWWELTALVPRLGYYADDVSQTPIDFHALLSLIAPRPLVINAGRQDSIFPNPKLLDETIDQARGVYRMFDAETKLQTTIFDGPHDFPQASRETAYAMLTTELEPE